MRWTSSCKRLDRAALSANNYVSIDLVPDQAREPAAGFVCSQENLGVSSALQCCTLLRCAHDGAADGDARGQDQSRHTDRQGRERQYESRLLRRTWRDGGTVRNQTLANLSKMPDRIVDAVEAALKGQVLVPAGEAAVTVARSLPHGHVAAVHAMARRLGLPALLGPAGRQRDLALALIVSRVVAPGSKLSTLAWWGDVTLGPDLGIEHAATDEAYAAMDWLAARQDVIERKLARRHLAPAANPQRMALFDLSSSWLEGSRCPLGVRGYSRDGKKGTVQIEYGLLTDPEGRPVAVRVFEGNTADPAAFTEILERSTASSGCARW